jgi:hypothetical protein
MAKHWGTLLAVILALLTSMGFQWGGPGQRLTRVEQRVDTLAAHVNRLGDSTNAHQSEILRKINLLIAARCAETSNRIAREALACR